MPVRHKAGRKPYRDQLRADRRGCAPCRGPKPIMQREMERELGLRAAGMGTLAAACKASDGGWMSGTAWRLRRLR
jgi:hypothetical protein